VVINDNNDLKTPKAKILDGMLDYMADGDVDYTKDDVEKCGLILEEHLGALAKIEDQASAMDCVKNTVLKLNDLNQNAGEELIETVQREEICEYIITAGAILGFNGPDEDVTEEWREW